MFGIADYPSFVIAVIVFLMIPGLGNLALVLSTSKGGLGGGIACVLGVIAADQVLMWLAVAGVSALLTTTYSPAFYAVQWLGAAYLVWLGLRMVIAVPGSQAVLTIAPRQFFRQAFFITLFNPKAVVFYMAFLPLFIDRSNPRSGATFVVMAATIVALTFVYGSIVVLLAHHFAERLRANVKVSGALQQLAGVALIAFGIKLALSHR